MLVRVLFFFFPMTYNESYFTFIYGQYFFNGDLPYCPENPDMYIVDYFEMYVLSFTYYVYYFLTLISFNQLAILQYVIKVFYFLFDFLAFYLLYSFLLKEKGEFASYVGGYLYALCPTSILFSAAFGNEESMILAFSFLSFYAFYYEKYTASAFFLSLAIVNKFFSILFLFLYIPVLLQKRKFKEVIIYFAMLIGLYFVLSLPFLISCPSAFIDAHVSILYRVSGIGFLPTPVNEFLKQTVFHISAINLNISIKTIITVVICVVLFLFLLSRKIEKESYVYVAILLLLLSPLIFFSLHYRFLYCAVPFIIIIVIEKNLVSINSLDAKKKLFIILNNVFGIFFIILYYTLFLNLSSILGGTEQYRYYMVAFAVYISIWFLINLKIRAFKKQGVLLYLFPTFFLFMAFILAFFNSLGFDISTLYIVGIACYVIGSYWIVSETVREAKKAPIFKLQELINFTKKDNSDETT